LNLFLVIMRIALINTILCFFIVIIGITLSSSASIDNDDYAASNIDWADVDTFHQLDARAAKSRFWKRVPPRRFWKRSTDNNINQQDKH
jgi:hypothetical protein